MQYKLFYPTDFSQIDDVFNDNIDVCVEDEFGGQYTFVVVISDNLKQIMSNCGDTMINPAEPFLIVECLSRENVEKAVAIVMNSSNELIGLYGSNDFS